MDEPVVVGELEVKLEFETNRFSKDMLARAYQRLGMGQQANPKGIRTQDCIRHDEIELPTVMEVMA